jgi:hypothetical protein
LIDGMEGCVTHGTASKTLNLPEYKIPGVRIAGKTGTAQLPGKLNMAWFICFAPGKNRKSPWPSPSKATPRAKVWRRPLRRAYRRQDS